MKQIIILTITTIAFGLVGFSQNNIETILAEIEKNNTMLSALRKDVEAQKLGNSTGNYLQNPEIEFHYLWSDHSTISNRTDISIKQTFDFPSAYKYKNQIVDIKNQQVDLEYKKQLRNLQLQVRLVCFDLVYQNALISELSIRKTHAKSIANSYKLKFDLGETNILEYNKAQLNLLNISKEMESNEIERNALLSELRLLNGGINIDFTDSLFQSPELAVDFEQWYEIAEQNNPVLIWLQREIEKSQKQEKFNRALSLPKIQAGYMSEKVVGLQYQGVIVGLSIPLWENKNTVKFAKANALAFESIAIDNKLQYYNRLKTMHTKAVALQKSTTDYRINLHSFDNSALVKKALDKGEISMIEYILELSIYYESVDRLLKLERELNITVAELNQYL